MATLPEVFQKLKDAHPSVFAERAGGSIVAQLISCEGMPLEIGQQREGFWLPAFPPPDSYGLFVGLSPRRQSLFFQRQASYADTPTTHTTLRTTYLRKEGEIGPSSVTVPLDPAVLELSLGSIVGGALILDATQAAEYNDTVNGLPEADVVKHGVELYRQEPPVVGYFALRTF